MIWRNKGGFELKDQEMKINEDILQKIKENSKGDIVIGELLRELVIEESFHERSWQWKEEYDKRISDHLKGWNN